MQSLRDLWARNVVRACFQTGPRIASGLRKRWAKLKNPHATIVFGEHVYAGPGFSIHAPFGGRFEAAGACEFRRNFRLELGGPETVVRFGEGCVATYDVLMQISTTLDVGERVMFGQSTMVVDGNHRFRDVDRPMLEQGYDFKPLRLDDDVTILTKCTIVANIGRRAVVAANSVVTRDVEAFTVVGGVPAKVLDRFGPAAGEPAGAGSA